MSCQAGQFRIFTDNRVALFCLRRMDSLHSPPLDKVTRQLILFCHQRNISFGACPHLRQDEYSCRPGFTSGAPCHRGDAWSRLFSNPVARRISPFLLRGSLCFKVHCEAILLHSPCADPEAYWVNASDLSFFQLESFPINICFPSTCYQAKACWRVSQFQGIHDPNSPARSVSGVDLRSFDELPDSKIFRPTTSFSSL